MYLRKITLRHFRNVGFAALDFSGRQQFLIGANGQGKTNLLEAAGFFTALRSFRTADNKLLIGHGQHLAAIGCVFEQEQLGDTHLTIKLRHDGKELWCEQARVTRLADHLGRFPTVAYTSQDLQLVRGSPTGRRRWIDLTLAAMDAGYLHALQSYTRALAGRNALLKAGRPAEKELVAFEQTLAPAAAELIARREAGLKALSHTFQAAYERLSDGAEEAGLAYEASFPEPSAEALLARLEAGRTRDLQFRSTLIGPHRDDFRLSVKHTAAKDYASEGQQRGLALALRMAQAAWFQEKSGIRPVLLADDVLGELDPVRRRRFWAAIDPEAQIIATGTDLPDADLGEWQIFDVTDGMFTQREVQVEAPG